ncbi:MAG: hypothetical protein JKY81_01500, partial [Colwellia sp.]|nr:hypothetical protein [Colwellia sp.]
EQFFANPTFANAADRAALSAQTRSGQTIDLTSNVSPDVLDRIKRTLGEQIATAKRQGDATQVGDLVSLQKRYVGFLDDQYPGVYAAARRAFAGPAAQEEALELGESLIRSTAARRAPEGVAQQIADMSVDEIAAFRVGVARSVVNQMRTAPSPIVRTGGAPVDLGTDPANPIRRFFNTDQQRDVIRAAFGNDAAFNQFAKRMSAEAQRAESFRVVNVRQGSPTQGRQRAVERLGQATEAATDIGMASSGNPIAALRSITNLLRRGQKAESPAVQEEIQRILFSTPSEQRPAIERALQDMFARQGGGDNALAVGQTIVGPLLTPTAIASERTRN